MAPSSTWALVAGGGTAGHLLPGLAVAAALVEGGHDPSTIHFVGSDRGVEAELVPAAGFSLDELPGRGIQRRLTVANVAAVWGLVRGTVRGMAIVRRRRPSVVVSLGGHAAFACALAAVVLRIPLVLLEQNARAGAVNRVLRRFAAASAVTFEGTDLPRATVTGNPLRPRLRAMAERMADPAQREAARSEARQALGLPPDRAVVAVFSGSLGSARINTAVRGLAERWADRSDLAIRHVTGRRDADELLAGRPALPPDGLQYDLVPYEDRMDLLLAAADVGVTRAGGSVAELAAVGLPSVLVPLPIATRDHQTANARAVADATGAVVVVSDPDCTTDRLEAELSALLGDPAELARRADALRAFALVDAAERVAVLVEEQAR